MNSNPENSNPANVGPESMLNAEFSMTNVQEVREDIARDTAEVTPASFEDALQPGFAGTKASKVRQEIQHDLQKARADRMQ